MGYPRLTHEQVVVPALHQPRRDKEVQETKKQAGRLSTTSCKATGWPKNSVAERPEAQKQWRECKVRVRYCLLTSQHMATMSPRTQSNYFHIVGNLYSPGVQSTKRLLFQSYGDSKVPP